MNAGTNRYNESYTAVLRQLLLEVRGLWPSLQCRDDLGVGCTNSCLRDCKIYAIIGKTTRQGGLIPHKIITFDVRCFFFAMQT